MDKNGYVYQIADVGDQSRDSRYWHACMELHSLDRTPCVLAPATSGTPYRNNHKLQTWRDIPSCGSVHDLSVEFD